MRARQKLLKMQSQIAFQAKEDALRLLQELKVVSTVKGALALGRSCRAKAHEARVASDRAHGWARIVIDRYSIRIGLC